MHLCCACPAHFTVAWYAWALPRPVCPRTGSWQLPSSSSSQSACRKNTDDIKVTSKSLHWQFDPLKPRRIVLHSANARLEARRLKRSASSMYKTPWYHRGRQISRGRQLTNCVCSWFQNDSQSFKWLKATLGSDVCKQYKVFVAQRKCHRRWACCPPFHATARPITMPEEEEELWQPGFYGSSK